MHTAKSLKTKKSYFIFIQQRKLKQIYYFSMHFGFNNQFIKVMRTLANISKKKNILFCFNVWDYEFIRKMYS
jgi:hypothetical protein